MKLLFVILVIFLCIYIGVYPSISTHLSCSNEKTKEEEFEISRHIINTFSFWIPAIIIYLILIIVVKGIGYFIPILPSAFAGMIGLIIGNSINISNADSLELPEDSPLVENEKLKRNIGVLSIFTSCFSMYRRTKQNIKDVANVDSWKEMK